MTTEISHLSTEYVKVRVRMTTAGVEQDPTADVVAFAFMPTPPADEPAPADWNAGSWESAGPVGPYFARCLVGPGGGGVALAEDGYTVWIKITDAPEEIVRPAGYLSVT